MTGVHHLSGTPVNTQLMHVTHHAQQGYADGSTDRRTAMNTSCLVDVQEWLQHQFSIVQDAQFTDRSHDDLISHATLITNGRAVPNCRAYRRAFDHVRSTFGTGMNAVNSSPETAPVATIMMRLHL
jgi:hypothetical protein